jgi:predicted peptidase
VRHRPFAASALLLASIALPSGAQTVTGFLDRTIVAGALTLRYQVYLPSDYDPSRAWPVILFLHGSGERGSDGLKQTQVGLGATIRLHRDWFPAIVLFPQAPQDSVWRGAVSEAAVEAVRRTVKELHGDPTRLYLAGLSMGGFGAWQIATDHPEMFAAIVAVCGGVAPIEGMPNLYVSTPRGVDPFEYVARHEGGTPAWLFHGAEDTSVPVHQSRRLASALHAAGVPVQYTEYPDLGHVSWDRAFGEPELWRWLFAQRRASR